MANPIQKQFGDVVINAFADFARSDLKSPEDYRDNDFAFVDDRKLRENLAEVFYGVRWIYKLGLALLTKNAERAAHVRAQIVDYASVVEALLSYCIGHAIEYGHTTGTGFNFDDPVSRKKPIKWIKTNPEPQLRKRSLWWLVKVSREFGIISHQLETEVDWLRKQRNTVHLRQRSSLGRTAYLNQSKRAFDACIMTIQATRRWKRNR